MATKISGIKGINISKASVLKDGSKKSGTNDSFRDTANGTTRDNSNNKTSLDAAMIKMLLGNTELMAKKAAEIEQKMDIAAKKEEERQKKNEENRVKQLKREIEQEKRREEQKRKESDRKIDSVYDKVDAGLINTALSSFLGPMGVLIGKGLNEAGLKPLTKRGVRAGVRGAGKIFSSVGQRWGNKKKKSKEDGEENSENESAVSVNKREMAAEPVNHLRTSVTKRLDTIINILGGRRENNFSGEEGEKKGLLSKLSDLLGPASWLGKLFKWLGPKLAYLAGIAALGYGFHKFWNWIKDKFGTDWANGLTFGLARAVKGALQGVGNSLKNAANSLKALKKGFTASKVWGAASRGLNKLANSSKVGKFLFGGAAKRARAASIAAQRTLQAGNLGKAGKFLAGTGKVLSKVGKAAGVVGNVVIAGESMYDAYQKYKKGDKRGAAGSLGKGAGTLAGGALGAKGGAALGAMIGSVVPGIGTLIGGAIGGIAGAIGGGWLGSKLGGKAGEKTYDLVTGTKPEDEPEVQSEGSYETEDPATYQSLQLQNESIGMQSEILNTLRQIEFNLNPATQKALDQAYLNNAYRTFDRPPEPYDLPQDFTPLNPNMTSMLKQ